MSNSPEKFYKERDKNLSTFLLACEEINFCGTEANGQTIFFLFSPRQRVTELVRLYYSKKEPCIPAKTLLESVDNFRTILFRAKDEISSDSDGDYYGKPR
ncbi:MAG: hypothetical protein HQ536_04050 [Parcubacteria group bacterium]|nr:hypothetical protein [Parcubacteria group bacterium]